MNIKLLYLVQIVTGFMPIKKLRYSTSLKASNYLYAKEYYEFLVKYDNTLLIDNSYLKSAIDDNLYKYYAKVHKDRYNYELIQKHNEENNHFSFRSIKDITSKF